VKRLTIVGTLAACLTLGVARSEAQVQVSIGNPSDSAIAVLSGTRSGLLVSAYNPAFNSAGCYGPTAQYYCLSYAKLTFVYDPTLIDSVAADTVTNGFSAVASATGPGTFTVTASGLAAGYQASLFRFRVKLAAGAHDGGYLWMRVDSLDSPSFGNIGAFQGGARAAAVQVCHATDVWGDVDGNGRVDSRDALITLSAAVGLPVSGFSLGFGDVDGDGLTNSRDALMTLSYAIALPISVANRVGSAIPDACPGVAAPGETIVFQRMLPSAGGVFRLDSLSTNPVQLTTNPSDAWPRLNAAGTAVAFQCTGSDFLLQICLVDRAGTGRRTITGPGLPQHMTPDWSPGGTRIAYLQQNGWPPVLYTMDSSGSGQFRVGAQVAAGWAAWSHDGNRLAYQDANSNAVGTVTMDTLHTIVSLGVVGAPTLRWSPGDTLVAYQPSAWGPIWGVPAAGGTPTPVVTIAGIQSFDWSQAGIVFTMALPNGSPSLWLLRGGPSGRLVRLTAPAPSGGDAQPSFRRNP
jgi:hypothetical protein